jgi:hypothetical protein
MLSTINYTTKPLRKKIKKWENPHQGQLEVKSLAHWQRTSLRFDF